jgi:hypothetical protein
MQVAASDAGTELMGIPTPRHLAILFLPPALLAAAAVITAALRSRGLPPPATEKPDLA